jgi:hypothetical protein
MSQPADIDGVLVQWGDRLFYPGNRIVKGRPSPKLNVSGKQRAAAIRQRIEATVVRRAPQVMVKVTGGGRGMKAIAAHLRYISKNGRLEIEDERGQTMRGKDSLRELADDWRFGGSLIEDTSERREAFNIMLSMPRGTDPLSVQWAAREFAKTELADHKFVMVLHDHQANPHVHISVRAESKHGKRLNPRKTDLHRWRETFAARLRERGIEAEATRQQTRGAPHRYPAIWQVKASQDGRLHREVPSTRIGSGTGSSHRAAKAAWRELAGALALSGSAEDQRLAGAIQRFLSTPLQRKTELQRVAGSNSHEERTGPTR